MKTTRFFFSSSSSSSVFTPPSKITDLYETAGVSKFSHINRPTAGARANNPLPRGKAPIQLYSLATPNGQKVSILLEELGVDYDAHRINILAGEQFTSGFVEVNPNSKIPCAVDIVDEKEAHLSESASIMIYFAEKYKCFIPADPLLRGEVMNWMFWQMSGQGPMTGNFGHFFAYAPLHEIGARQYGVHRYGMEVQRLCSVLDKHLEDRTYLVNDEYTIADMCCYPWFQMLRRNGYRYQGQDENDTLSCTDFLDVETNYPHACQWADRVKARPAVKRGMTVCGFKVESVKPWLDDNEN